jgi:5-methylcytosine-specific restriction endonuclease McrA
MSFMWRGKVLPEDPHPQSQASLRQLQNNLFRESTSRLAVWLNFREKLLRNMQFDGPLVCHYCGKNNLQIETDSNSDPFLATLDHVIPRSKGGAEYDLNNLVVACFPCNSKKRDTILTGP